MPYWTTPYQTQSAGTEIVEVIPPVEGKIVRCTGFEYVTAGTAHTISFMAPQGITTTTVSTTAGNSTIDVANTKAALDTSSDPEEIATSDWIAYFNRWGNLEWREVSSLSGDTVTLAAAVTYDVPTGTLVYFFMEPARATHLKYTTVASATTTRRNINIVGGVPKHRGIEWSRSGVGEPLMILSTNVTAAGTLAWATGDYVDASEIAMR